MKQFSKKSLLMGSFVLIVLLVLQKTTLQKKFLNVRTPRILLPPTTQLNLKIFHLLYIPNLYFTQLHVT